MGLLRFATGKTLWCYNYEIKTKVEYRYTSKNIHAPQVIEKISDFVFNGRSIVGQFTYVSYTPTSTFAVNIDNIFYKWDNVERYSEPIKMWDDSSSFSDREGSKIVGIVAISDNLVYYCDEYQVRRGYLPYDADCAEGNWDNQMIHSFADHGMTITQFEISNDDMLIYLNNSDLYVFRSISTLEDGHWLTDSGPYELSNRKFLKIHMVQLEYFRICDNTVVLINKMGTIFLYDFENGQFIDSIENKIYFHKQKGQDLRQSTPSVGLKITGKKSDVEEIDYEKLSKPTTVVVYGRGKWISKNETIDPNKTMLGNETSDGLDRSSLGMKYSMGKDFSIKERRVLCVGYDNGDVVIVNLVNKEKFMYSVGSPIKTMHYCEENKILFVLSQNSNLTLIDIAKESIFSKELFRMVGSIYCTRCSYDNESIYVGGANGVLKKISIKECALVEDLGQIHRGAIFSFCMSPNGEWLFTSDSKGEIKQFSLNKDSYHEHIGDCVDVDADLEKAHDCDIRAMECTGDSESFFSADKSGVLKQWSTEDLSLLEDYGKSDR